MTEEDARDFMGSSVSRGTMEWLELYASLLRQAATAQNLIAGSTLNQLWSRHIADSAQLDSLGPREGIWLDIGSGAGLPGLVIAILRDTPVTLIEPRAKRAAFLNEMVALLALQSRVTVLQSRAETAAVVDAVIISARAVAALGDLFAMGLRHSGPSTVWVLPKGRGAVSEVALAESSWHAEIKLVPSITDSDASIIVATNVVSRSLRQS